MDILERLESNVRSYSRSFPTVFTRAKMSKMYSKDGKEYIDFFDGAGALSYGHNNEYIKKKVIEYIANDGISHALDMFTEAKEEFFRSFEEKILKPAGYDYKLLSCAPTGTNAVEASLKLARKVKKRPGIFAFTGSFHGMTMGSLSVTSGKTIRAGAGVELTDVTFVPHPCSFKGDVIEYIESIITDEYSGVMKPAAIILETVQAEGGVRLMPPEFLRRLRTMCDRQDVLMIIDDIQVGCGRTGSFFSFEGTDVVPDMVALSKAISGYGFPMSLLLMKPELDIFSPGEHNGTFRGNQVSFIGAKAALELREMLNLKSKTKQNGELIGRFVETRLLPLDGRLEYRGIGMIHGIDFEALGDESLSGKVAAECFRLGLIIERAGRKDCVIKIMPALTIEREELLAGLEIIEKAMIKYLS